MLLLTPTEKLAALRHELYALLFTQFDSERLALEANWNVATDGTRTAGQVTMADAMNFAWRADELARYLDVGHPPVIPDDWTYANTRRYLEALLVWCKPAPSAAPLAADTVNSVDDLVNLDEAAAMVHRSKRTLEKQLSKMPAPYVPGGGGKPTLWKWAVLRPWLEKEYVPNLPQRFPRNVR